MIRCLTTFLFGMLLGAGMIWYFVEGKTWVKARGASSAEPTESHRTVLPDISAEEVQEELQRTGGVVRRRATPPEEVGEDAAQVATSIRNRLSEHRRLKEFEITVEVQAERVLLSGRVDSPEDIAAAMNAAMNVAGRREVISLLHLRAVREQAPRL